MTQPSKRRGKVGRVKSGPQTTSSGGGWLAGIGAGRAAPLNEAGMGMEAIAEDDGALDIDVSKALMSVYRVGRWDARVGV